MGRTPCLGGVQCPLNSRGNGVGFFVLLQDGPEQIGESKRQKAEALFEKRLGKKVPNRVQSEQKEVSPEDQVDGPRRRGFEYVFTLDEEYKTQEEIGQYRRAFERIHFRVTL